ncbi:MAG: hypothetical protein OXP75_01095 [Rhodospirillales bacterium]|nr:hypothetical protein [Rhodospirillales bacterium]
MPVTITVQEVAVAIRATADDGEIPAAISTTLGFLFPAASALVVEYAPDAPDAVQNAAAVRLTGWLFDADPTDPRLGQAMQVSGAAPLLAKWRVHRAGAIGPASGGAAPGPAPAPGAGLPDVPGDGSFILTVNNGVLAWVAFPLP